MTATAGALTAVLVAGSGVLPGGQGEAVAAVRCSSGRRHRLFVRLGRG
ncbi:hypothetical protein SSPS47_21055 [Streptomyces sp. S4.7]|nr:hypothetical protein SSPS47_21055 [Streptomyces sp. S4.7]